MKINHNQSHDQHQQHKQKISRKKQQNRKKKKQKRKKRERRTKESKSILLGFQEWQKVEKRERTSAAHRPQKTALRKSDKEQ